MTGTADCQLLQRIRSQCVLRRTDRLRDGRLVDILALQSPVCVSCKPQFSQSILFGGQGDGEEHPALVVSTPMQMATPALVARRACR